MKLLNSETSKAARNFFSRPRVPPHLAANILEIETEKFDAINLSLQKNYFAHSPEGYLSTDAGRDDLQNHLHNRLAVDRNLVIPWLDESRPLRESSVLEIGCGTGCSTVALAEQGAKVTAIDVDEKSLRVAVDRLRAYGLEAELLQANATEVSSLFRRRHFDLIIFYASLEHMTIDERLQAMRGTWEMLSDGDLWCVIETPNRLWYYDSHTSFLPFYMWLPDELAFRYSGFSRRDNFRELYGEDNAEARLDFLRKGRGVGFHEFDLAMKPVGELRVKSSLLSFIRRKSLLGWMSWRPSTEYRYKTLLRKIAPYIHEAFFQPYLNLIIERN